MGLKMIIDIHSHIGCGYVPREEEEKRLLADMKKNGIDKRVVSSVSTSYEEGNRHVSELVSRHQDCLMGCAVVNPKEADCREKALDALSLSGMAMLELNSLEDSYYPDICPGVEEALQAAAEKKVPVKIFSGLGARAIPWQWVKHVENHPELEFIFLHMGCFDYGYGCVELAKEYENIWLETSNQYEIQILKKALTTVSEDKVLFGSMYPERFTRCSLDVFDTLHPGEGWKKAWLGDNAERLLAGRA